MRHVNIPIFIPHLGCPNQCVFCNQKSISGVDYFDSSSVINIIENALQTISKHDDVEIAFFGGSFTGIDRELMIDLLQIAYSFIKSGRVSSIRCSTRPDYIDPEILSILKKYGVKTIELGLQSCSDDVLKLTKRGHNFEAEKLACDLIVKQGFDLVGQMMIGLPGSTLEIELETCKFIIDSGAKAARIYPTVVFRDTELCTLTELAKYNPLTIDQAIERSARVLEKFIDNNVDVIRIGLQSSENLSNDKYCAGPNHPALGELVIGELYFNKIAKILQEKQISSNDNITVFVSKGALSKAVGQNGKNKKRLAENFKFLRFAENDRLNGYEISVENTNGENKCI